MKHLNEEQTKRLEGILKELQQDSQLSLKGVKTNSFSFANIVPSHFLLSTFYLLVLQIL